jgi:Phage integrase central domain/Arm DNA-binding domain
MAGAHHKPLSPFVREFQLFGAASIIAHWAACGGALHRGDRALTNHSSGPIMTATHAGYANLASFAVIIPSENWAVVPSPASQAPVTPEGTRNWVLRYMLDRRAHWMGLGPVSLYGLADARARALDARRKRHDGIDPIAARRAERARQQLDAAKAITFKQCAESYVAAHCAGWRNEKHAAQWSATLSSYAYPVIGALPVQAVDTGLVLKVLEPIWTAKPETASRLRGRLESILDFAKVRGHRDGENPARWRGHLAKLLPARFKVRAIEHHPALRA